MSLLPGQVQPESVPIGRLNDDGSVTIDHNWWLLFYNICLRSINSPATGPIAASSIVGNNTGGTALPIALTPTQVKALLSYALASSDFANQGTTTTVLHGNAAGNPSFGPISLTADITGVLQVTSGGTGSTTSTGSGSVVLGTAPVLTGATVTPSATAAAGEVGYLGSPVTTQNNAYGFVLTDSGTTVYHDETTARTWTIPANASVAFAVGTIIILDNTGNSGGTPGAITLAITSDTLRRGDGTAGTGSRTIPANAKATIQKLKSTEWVISGVFT